MARTGPAIPHPMTAILVDLIALEEPASFAIVVTEISSVGQNAGRDGIVLV